MLLYNNTIHEFDIGRWLMRDEITEVHCYTTVAIRPEVAEYDDVVASVVNLRYRGGAIDNVESYVQAAYGCPHRNRGIEGIHLCRKLSSNSRHVLDR
jgi:predicted dehydrogenase